MLWLCLCFFFPRPRQLFAEHCIASKYVYCVSVLFLLSVFMGEEFLNPEHVWIPGYRRDSFCRRGLSHSAFDWPAWPFRSHGAAGLLSAVDASDEWLLLPFSATPQLFSFFFLSHSYGYHVSPRLPPPTKKTTSHWLSVTKLLSHWPLVRLGAPPSPVSRVSWGAQEGGSASAAGPRAAATRLRQSLAGHVGRPGLGQEPPEGRRRSRRWRRR